MFFLSCAGKYISDEIVPVSRAPLSREIIGWGVISSSYTHVLDKRGEEGAALGLLRKGSVVEVLERRPFVRGDKPESWVFASGAYSGWLREEHVNIYDSRAKALTAAGSIEY